MKTGSIAEPRTPASAFVQFIEEPKELVLKNKAGDYVVIPKKYRTEVQDMIKENYDRIKEETTQIVAEELQRIKDDPALAHLLQQGE